MPHATTNPNSSSFTILIVDDEIDLLALLAYNLKKEGFGVESATTGKEAVQKARLLVPNLIILDLMLPDLSGLEVCKILKSGRDTEFIPIIMLTAKVEERDRIVGLELGADDYITKPFSPRELILRIKAVLKRVGPTTPLKPFRLGSLFINPLEYKVSVQGQTINLTPIEYKLLLELSMMPEVVKSRHRLLEWVWGYSSQDIETRTVDAHIKRLRGKLGQAGNYIKTVRGVGYKIEAV